MLVCCAFAGCPHGGDRARAPTAAELCPAEVCPELGEQPPAEKRGEQPYAIVLEGHDALFMKSGQEPLSCTR